MIQKIDHIAIGVNKLDEAVAFYRDVLGLPVSQPEEVASQKVRVVFVPIGEVKLELMEPTADDSPLAKSMAKRGEGIQHICFGVDDVHQALDAMKKADRRSLQDEPVEGAHDTLAFFLHPKAANGVLLEFNQKKRD